MQIEKLIFFFQKNEKWNFDSRERQGTKYYLGPEILLSAEIQGTKYYWDKYIHRSWVSSCSSSDALFEFRLLLIKTYFWLIQNVRESTIHTDWHGQFLRVYLGFL